MHINFRLDTLGQHLCSRLSSFNNQIERRCSQSHQPLQQSTCHIPPFSNSTSWLVANCQVSKVSSSKAIGHLYSTLLWDEPIARCSDMTARGSQFYLPPTHEPYLPLLPSHRASPPFGWYSLRLPTEGWPGWVHLGDWLYTEILSGTGSWTPDTVTHPSTNRAQHRLTSLIETNTLTTTPNRQP